MLKKLLCFNLCLPSRLCRNDFYRELPNFITQLSGNVFYVSRGFTRICIVIFLTTVLAHGSSIEVNPVRLQLLPGQKITSLEIANHSGAPVVLQLKAVKWKKVLGKDVHEETKDVLITPPLISLDAEEKQLVRLGMTTPSDAQKGATYRLIINEVPSPNVVSSLGIKTLLEIRIPLVVSPLVPSKPKILWVVTRLGEKKLNVTLQNMGESYLSLRGISLYDKNEEKPFVQQSIPYYILPSQKLDYEFDLPDSFKGNDVKISAQTDQGEVTKIVPLSSS